MQEFLTTKTEWAGVVMLAPAFVALFGACTLLMVKNKSRDKRMLTLLLFVVCACMIAYFISDYLLLGPPYGVFRFFDSLSGLIITPMIFGYFAVLIHPFQNHRRELLRWFLPAIILLLAYVPLMVMDKVQPEAHTWNDFFDKIWHVDYLLQLVVLLVFIFEMVYCNVRVVQMRRKYAAELMNTQSTIEEIDLRWVNYIVALLCAFGVVSVFGIVLPGLEWKLLFSLFSTVSMFFVFICGYLQTDISAEVSLNETEDAPSAANDSSALSKTDVLVSKINALMNDKQLYLDQNLTVQHLADALLTNRSYVSKAINSQSQTFYDFINAFRTRHAINLLEQYDGAAKFTDIAQRSGFKSYSIFCRLFLEATGYLPRDFVKKA